MNALPRYESQFFQPVTSKPDFRNSGGAPAVGAVVGVNFEGAGGGAGWLSFLFVCSHRFDIFKNADSTANTQEGLDSTGLSPALCRQKDSDTCPSNALAV